MKKIIIMILAIAIAGICNINSAFAGDDLMIKYEQGTPESNEASGTRLEGVINGTYDGNKVIVGFNDNAGVIQIDVKNQDTPLLNKVVNTEIQSVVELDVSNLSPGTYRIDFVSSEGGSVYSEFEVKK